MASTTRADRRAALAVVGGQGFRFVLTGGFVALVYVAVTTLLAEVVGLPFEAALAIGFALAIVTHFSLQRFFVWRHPSSFALPLHHQLARYLTLAGLQYGLTAGITAVLPRALGVSPEVVYLPTVVALSTMNFLAVDRLG
jgi:putative flippase GtrA